MISAPCLALDGQAHARTAGPGLGAAAPSEALRQFARLSIFGGELHGKFGQQSLAHLATFQAVAPFHSNGGFDRVAVSLVLVLHRPLSRIKVHDAGARVCAYWYLNSPQTVPCRHLGTP